MTIASWMSVQGSNNGDNLALILLIGIPAMLLLLVMFNRPKRK